jgi:hypothetical protein
LFEERGFGRTTRAVIPEKLNADCASCDRRFACREIAVAMDLVPAALAAAASTRSERRLTVLRG